MATPATPLNKYKDIPCCPNLDTQPVCDVMDMRRRLLFPTTIRTRSGQQVNVEVILHTRFKRCSGPMALGDVVYTTTLLPGEKVRLATTDRRSRFSFDSESNLSYRSEQMSEEQYRMSSLRSFMSDQNSQDNGSTRNTDQGSWDFHGDASGSIGFMSASADANAHGSHNAESTFEYLQQHSAQARMADNLSVESTRKAHSMSVGEVSTRAHQQGETEDQYEASSREFANPNACHALTFLFYRINKIETLSFELVAIERRVLDPVAPAPLLANPICAKGAVAVMPQEVPAMNAKRLDIESRGLQSEALQAQAGAAPATLQSRFNLAALSVPVNVQTPLPDDVRKAALAEVDKQLVERKLLDPKTGGFAADARTQFEYTRDTSLPTAGVIVKGCFDDCNICEPELQKKTQLEIVRLDLQNQLLKRQIELLDKAQEYRCCPVAESGTT
ncbi:DUF2382 domain-containing protein [Rhodanobacter sp. Root179]|uniref:hypothetical protein n=1 Tax=Rhodanobacter sp. Root179 TaxID=1736482 RepID=UPI000701A80D|nr:hypothetical protein [Rhodanobacter sp. Root179]KRB37417.1 hypothetical protein ASD82_12280 [Rhodanobacter sp. Root179]